jgi:hypothetical protein
MHKLNKSKSTKFSSGRRNTPIPRLTREPSILEDEGEDNTIISQDLDIPLLGEFSKVQTMIEKIESKEIPLILPAEKPAPMPQKKVNRFVENIKKYIK